MIRRAVATFLAGTGVFGLGAYMLGGVGIAAVPSSVSVYGGAANAAGVHVVAGTNTFENFSTGAVDNRYPFANVTQDVSPATGAHSSYDDYGPLAGNVYLNVPPDKRPQNPPVDYANAQYPSPPGKPDEKKASPDGHSHYEAHARELSADALGYYAGSDTTTFQNMTAETHTIVGADGSIKTSTHAHVGNANFGVVEVTNTDVVTSIVSLNGKATVKDSIYAGRVTVNGQPVSVSDQGITVAATQAGLPGGVAGQTPLIHVFTVAPRVKNDGHGGASIIATGLHVGITQPGQGATVPSQYTEYILGEGSASDFLVPASGAGVSVDTSSGSAVTSGATDTTPVGQAISQTIGAPPNVGAYDNAAPINTVPHQASKRRPATRLLATIKPPVAYMFFLWETLVLGAASSVVWARRSSRVVV